MRDLSHHASLRRLFGIAATAFLVFLVALLAVRLYVAREAGDRNAASHFELANSELTDVFLQQGLTVTDFVVDGAKVAFFGEAAQKLMGEAGLAAMILRGPEGVLYAYAPERDLFAPAEGPPQKLRLPSLHTMYAAPFTGDPATTLTASYRLVSRERAFQIVRDALFLVLAFLLACAIALLLIVTLTPQPRSEAREPWPDGVDEESDGQNGAVEPEERGAGYGLEPQDRFMERLRGELERAAAYQADLSVVLGVLLAAEATTDDSSARMADLVRELALLPELAFAYGQAGFALILPETDLDAAIAQLESWRRKASAAGLSIAVGIGDRSGRHLEGDRLLLEAEQALGKAMANGGQNLVAFRADPARYRVLEAAAQS
jgi:GGDEF domain-containing protein